MNLIDTNNINIEQISDNCFKITCNNQKLSIKLSKVKPPFGLDKEYNNLYLKLQLNDQNLVTYVKEIESKISNHLNQTIKSQLRNDNILTCKIPKIKNKIVCDIKDINGSYYNIYNISKNQVISCELFIDNIWKYNDQFFYKWNYKTILIN